jgi:hypothetical protein
LFDLETTISIAAERDVEAKPRSAAFTPETFGYEAIWQHAIYLKMHAEVPRNYDYYDHNADDVKNVHCNLQPGMRALDGRNISNCGLLTKRV